MSRQIRIAIIDSGVNPEHPHVNGVAGGVHITTGGESPLYLDILGHGTAVAGAIRERAPDAALYAVKVFDRTLTTTIEIILCAIEWCLIQKMDMINLSLGTRSPRHRVRFEALLDRVTSAGATIIAPFEMEGERSFPGSLPGTIAVKLDADCPRSSYRSTTVDGRPVFLASGNPREIPGVPPDRNLHGISFAVANLTGFAARTYAENVDLSPAALASALLRGADAVPAIDASPTDR